MSETFSEKLRSVRKSKVDIRGRVLSQEGASRIFDVSLSTWRNWEANPPRALPDQRSRKKMEQIWPEMFS